jgi:hypothetical protein
MSAPVEAYKHYRPSDPSSSSSETKTPGAGSGAGASSKVGATKMMSSLVKGSLVDFPVALTEGLHNVPMMYGEKVRQRKPITDWKSGTREAGKNFVNGFADPIWCLFKQPAVGITKHGGLGLVTGLGKAGMGLVVKPGSGKQLFSFICVTTALSLAFCTDARVSQPCLGFWPTQPLAFTNLLSAHQLRKRKRLYCTRE